MARAGWRAACAVAVLLASAALEDPHYGYGAAPAGGASTLPAVPTQLAQERVKKDIRATYAGDYEAARKGAAARAALAVKLVQVGKETPSGSPERYTLFAEARDLAAEAGDYATAFAAVDALSESFAFDGMDAKATVLQRASSRVDTSTAQAEVARAGLDLVITAELAEKTGVAGRLLAVASSAAAKSRDESLSQQAKDIVRDVHDIEQRSSRRKLADVTLRQKPEDPDANLAVGQHLAFVLGQWAEALPRLAKGSDATLKGLASAEQARPAEPAGKLRLGDGWWAVAESQSGRCREIIRQHAAEWYRPAVAGLTGFDRERVEARLKQVKPSNGTTEVVTVAAPAGPTTALAAPPTSVAAKSGERSHPPGAAPALAANLLRDPEFATLGAHPTDWKTWANGSARIAASVDKATGGAAAIKLAISATTGAGQDIGLSQGGFSFSKGQIYTLSFRARAEPPVAIDVSIEGAGFKNLGLYKTVNLTEKFTDCRYVVGATGDDKGAVIFKTGRGVSDVYLSDVRLCPGRVVNLLPLIDPHRDAVKGQWKIGPDGLTSDDDQCSRIRIPYRPPEEYDFCIEFTRKGGDNIVSQILTAGGRDFNWLMGGRKSKSCGFELIDGKKYAENKTAYNLDPPFQSGTRYHAVVQVRKGEVVASIDGVVVSRHVTDFTDCTISPGWDLKVHGLGIGTLQTPTVFHVVEVTEVTGKGEPLAGAPKK